MNALAVLAFGVFLVIAGYQAGIARDTEMQGIVFAAVTLVPAASCFLSAVPFAFYRLEFWTPRRHRSADLWRIRGRRRSVARRKEST